MSNFKEDLRLLFEKYEVELSIDDNQMHINYDITYVEDGIAKGIALSGKGPYFVLDSKELVKQIDK